ncbi:hypothetical protein EDB80DRAFT_756466 [Ilyonectria destructans]|nr:hypothetical protein EDB80DRAFT_756466 [Ilyonectria destructans]
MKSLGYIPLGRNREDRRPAALESIENEQLKGKWCDKTVLVTGCFSGIGTETAKALYETGAAVFATARDLSKAKGALSSIVDSKRIHLLELDLNSLASERKCADAFLAQSNRLNVLINNAGVMATPEERTADGFETQFGTNHLAHFLLIQLLLPTLPLGSYQPWSFSAGKTANLWISNKLECRFGLKGVHSLIKMFKSPQQGAATTIWAATSKAFEGQGGKYLEDCQIAKPPKLNAV